MPNVNLQEITLSRLPLTLVLHAAQQSYGDHVVQPVVVLIARLEQHSQLQTTSRLRRPRGLQQDVRAVVRAEIVPRVRAEDARLRIREAPVCSKVQDFSWGCMYVSLIVFPSDFSRNTVSGWARAREGPTHTSKSRTGEVAADDGDGLADPARALGLVEAVFAFGEGCVEEREAWSRGFGDRSVLGAGEEGEGSEGQELLEIHGR